MPSNDLNPDFPLRPRAEPDLKEARPILEDLPLPAPAELDASVDLIFRSALFRFDDLLGSSLFVSNWPPNDLVPRLFLLFLFFFPSLSDPEP
ncbi:hypothetical protein D3C80_1833900 [compost metagenome]